MLPESPKITEREKCLLNSADDTYPLYSTSPPPAKAAGTIRIWVDGCFDMMHLGHYNVLRQAAALGHELFVGVHSDAEILAYKGPCLLYEEERYALVRSCRWVTFVVENAPYVTRVPDMRLLEIDHVVHGDDVSTDLDGRNSYQSIIDAGLFRVVKRTDGISTTEIVRRILSLYHEKRSAAATRDFSYYITTSRKIAQFSRNTVPQKGQKIVYIDGTFDLLHHRDVALLQAARQLGDYLIVGIHSDTDAVSDGAGDFPVLNVNERTLTVLANSHVNEVLIGVRPGVTKELLDTMHIDLVAVDAGVDCTDRTLSSRNEDGGTTRAPPPLYSEAQQRGILHWVQPSYKATKGQSGIFTRNDIIQRVIADHEKFLERNKRKYVKDALALQNKPLEFQNVVEL